MLVPLTGQVGHGLVILRTRVQFPVSPISQKWRDFVENMDQKTDMTKLWRTIKGIDGRAKREAENEAITFNGSSLLSSKQIATKFNQQFNTSKLGRHTSSRETRVLSYFQEETIGEVTNIHRGSSNERVVKIVRPLAPTSSASST